MNFNLTARLEAALYEHLRTKVDADQPGAITLSLSEKEAEYLTAVLIYAQNANYEE